MNSIYRTAVKGWKDWANKSEPVAVPMRLNRLAEPDWSAHLSTLLDPINTIYGAVRGLLAGRDEGVVVHIVSATPGEGTSTVARALANKAATMGNLGVFLMDGNDTGQGSAFAAIKNSKSYRDSAAAVPSLNDPAGIGAIYTACRREYQLTILDCPSVYSGRFFETIPKLSDGIILVVEAEKLRPAMVRQIIQMLEQQGITCFGIVLNKAHQYVPKIFNKLI
jgi:Mrp family chromosome partitioning ATPase